VPASLRWFLMESTYNGTYR